MRRPAILFFVLLVVLSSVVPAQTGATVSGTMHVNGKAMKLACVQAIHAEDWTFGTDNKPVSITVTKVLLSDAPAYDLEDIFELSIRAKEGKLHGLLLKFSEDGKPMEGTIFDESLKTGTEPVFLSSVDFQDTSFTKASVAAKGQTKEPIDLISLKEPLEGSTGKLELTVAFDTPFQPEPRPTAEGPSAVETGPAKAAQEFIRATEAKDVPAMKRIVRKEVVEMLENPEAQQTVMGMLGESYPPGKQFTNARVFDFGDHGWVEYKSQRLGDDGKPVDETYKIRVVRVNGEWKVSPF